MAEETHMAEPVKPTRIKRKSGHKKGSRAKKKQKSFQGTAERVKIDPKLKKFLRKKARDYNSDTDDDSNNNQEEQEDDRVGDDDEDDEFSGQEDADKDDFGIEVDGSENDEVEEEDGVIQPGITKLNEGCRAFGIAFRSIMKKSVSDDALGPVLSGHKKLLAEKLAEEEAEKKVKGEAKKEKQLVGEKAHLKPASFLDSHEKFLISVATKGVVKLFNAVNKAQHAQKGLNPSRSKDAKVINKRKREAFFSELGKTPVADTSAKYVQPNTSSRPTNGEGPSWAPLRDNYMLTSSKLKDWDKMPETVVADEIGRMYEDSGSDDD